MATKTSKTIVDSVGLEPNQKIASEAIDGQIVITPKKPKKEYRLDELLQRCNPEKMRLDKEDEDWLNGKPTGNEI